MPRPAFWPARKQSEHSAPASDPAPTQRSLARRALTEPTTHKWRHRGLAALAVAVLGIGTAGSVALVDNAEHPVAGGSLPAAERPAVERSVTAGVPRPRAFLRESTAGSGRDGADGRPTRDAVRSALPAQPPASITSAARARAVQLAKRAEATKKEAAKLAEKKAKKEAEKRAEELERRKEMLGDGEATLPVSGARVAAGFGATGAWARYHTGVDFSAGTGTSVRAPRAGVVTTAGSGRASGWAGTYVAIEHSDGTSSLYAHLSAVEVSSGDEVSAGQLVGRVGQTGRAFGPHLHFEIYPAGVEPGDVYQAVDPWPWLNDLGLGED